MPRPYIGLRYLKRKAFQNNLRYCVRCNKPFLRETGEFTCSKKCSIELHKQICHKRNVLGKYHYDIFRKQFHNEKVKMRKEIGDKCIICGSKMNLVFHEIHGKKHSCNFTYSNKIENKKDLNFVCLCNNHHTALHFLSKTEKTNWKKFLELLDLLKLK